jgi:hypothetical protein
MMSSSVECGPPANANSTTPRTTSIEISCIAITLRELNILCIAANQKQNLSAFADVRTNPGDSGSCVQVLVWHELPCMKEA